MSSRAFEEFFDATVPTVEAVPVDLSDPGLPSYPHQTLKATGRKTDSTFRAVVLENSYLRVTVCPDLGGRIIRLLDKRTGTEILPARDMTLTGLGRRGVSLVDGVAFFGDEPHSALSMSQVDYVVHEPDDETGSAAVMTHSLLVGTGLSLQTCVTLPPDSAQVLVEMRVHNRTLLPVDYSCGCCVGLERTVGSAFYDDERDAGLFFDGAFFDDSSAVFCIDDGVLAPRESVEHRLRIVPFAGLGGFAAGSQDMIANVSGCELRIQSTARFNLSKVFLLTQDSETMETDADLDPATVFRANLPDGAAAVTVRSPEKAELLNFRLSGDGSKQRPVKGSTAWRAMRSSAELARRKAPPESIEELLFADVLDLHVRAPLERHVPGVPVHVRGLAHLIAAKHAAATSDLRSADDSLNEALSTLGDDPLTWWMKAVVQRLLGEADEERPELLNAHYLSPLEPALRAESFLSLDQTMGSEPNPIMKPLVDDPDAMHEVVHLLVEAGLFGEAARLIDEAQRHREHPLLRYMFAWCLLRGTRMVAEASEQVKRAGEAELGAPFPWRPFEVRAVRELAARFPDDFRLKTLAKIIDVNRLGLQVV